MSGANAERPISVRGTDIVRSDPARIRLQKLARITLDSIVQFIGLVERHGGSVSARSDGAGRSSEFIVRLPAAPPASSHR